ncbi:NF038130 family PEP-CTERM protein [Candidatus Accumulibacter phosphatis]|jgi:hypothetical protein|nr:NF038130 family PEP-CTERM protein [Candidatus Accumulibacter phosphatis]
MVFAYKLSSQVLLREAGMGPCGIPKTKTCEAHFNSHQPVSDKGWYSMSKEFPMNAFCNKTKIALAVAALAVSTGASAVSIQNVVVGPGGFLVWNGAPLLTAQAPTQANAIAALGGNAAAPNGNVELNKFGGDVVPGFGPVTTLSGDDGLGHGIKLMSMQLTDWGGQPGGDQALAKEYIQGAANRAELGTLTPVDMDNALAVFFAPNANLGGMAPWQLVSDPNISYVDILPTKVHLGLAGFLNATPFLEVVFGVDLKEGLQVSEVVKYEFGGRTGYAYGFWATPSHVASRDGSYSGNFALVIPEPASLALFGIGLLGLCLGRRRA